MGSTYITWELVRNVNSWGPPQTYGIRLSGGWPRNLCCHKPPQVRMHVSLRNTAARFVRAVVHNCLVSESSLELSPQVLVPESRD